MRTGAINMNPFRSGTFERDLHAVILDNFEYQNGNVAPWKEEFRDEDGEDCLSYRARVFYDVMIDDVKIREKMFCKLTFKGGSQDIVDKKLKVGSKLRFSGKYLASKGVSRWFYSFTVLHPKFVEIVKAIPKATDKEKAI